MVKCNQLTHLPFKGLTSHPTCQAIGEEKESRNGKDGKEATEEEERGTDPRNCGWVYPPEMYSFL